MCDSKVSSNKFYVQRKLICGEYIESQYYNNLGGNKAKNISKVGILVTRNICAMCYSFQDVFPGSEKRGDVIFLLYVVISSIVILEFQPWADPVMYDKSRD